MSTRLAALSIRQPWAWAILHAGKRIENRSWATKYRGPILIHASKWWNAEEVYDMFQDIENLRSRLGYPRYPGAVSLRSLRDATGGFVGRANVVDCIPWGPGRDHDAWHIPGNFGFKLADVEPIPFVPWTGALGIFTVPADALANATEPRP